MKIIRNIVFLTFCLILAGIIALSLVSKLTGKNYFQQIKISITGLFNKKNEDTIPLKSITNLSVNYFTRTISTLKDSVSITLTSNKPIFIDDSTRVTLLNSKLPNNQDNNISSNSSSDTNNKLYWYVVEIHNLGLGDNNIKFQVKDQDGTKLDIALTVHREDVNLPFGIASIQDWPESKYTADGDNLIALVNKNYKLPQDYAPHELIDINIILP